MTNAVPFPARHGVELPLERLIRQLAPRHTITLIVTGSGRSARAEFAARAKNVPDGVTAHYLDTARPGRLAGLLREALGIRPSFEVQGSTDRAALEAVAGQYDLLWFSPIGGLGLLGLFRRAGLTLTGRLAVGLNDATYMLYARGWRHLIRGRLSGEWRRLVSLARVPWISLYERRYLRGVDLIHVQTPLEQARTARLGLGPRPAFVTAQNGRSETISHSVHDQAVDGPSDGRTVLFMTHLARGRKTESRWFLDRVWPRVLGHVPDARLWLVGSPPDDQDRFAQTLPPNVQIRGYVPDLGAVFAETAVAVLPTLHHSGWVNRISDYFQAGLPVVACSEPASTITGLVPGVHAVVADGPGAFADAVARLLTNPEQAAELARAGHDLAQTFPTWDQTIARLEDAIRKTVDR